MDRLIVFDTTMQIRWNEYARGDDHRIQTTECENGVIEHFDNAFALGNITGKTDR